MRRLPFYILAVLITAHLLAGCKVKRPDNVIPEDKLEELLYDYHLARAIGDEVSYSENYKKELYIDYVFRKYGVSRAEFDTSMVWYTRHADVLADIYKRVNQRFDTLQVDVAHRLALRNTKHKISEKGDSVDVWVSRKLIELSPEPLHNLLTFTIPSDSNYEAKDTLSWNMTYRYLGTLPDSAGAARMSITVQYAKDTVVNRAYHLYHSGSKSIRIQADTLGDIKEIRGFVYMRVYPDKPNLRLLLNDISLMRYHAKVDSLALQREDSLKAIRDTLSAMKKDTLSARTLITVASLKLDTISNRPKRP